MTEHGDFKKQVRARMDRTGENFTTARRKELALRQLAFGDAKVSLLGVDGEEAARDLCLELDELLDEGDSRERASGLLARHVRAHATQDLTPEALCDNSRHPDVQPLIWSLAYGPALQIEDTIFPRWMDHVSIMGVVEIDRMRLVIADNALHLWPVRKEQPRSERASHTALAEIDFYPDEATRAALKIVAREPLDLLVAQPRTARALCGASLGTAESVPVDGDAAKWNELDAGRLGTRKCPDCTSREPDFLSAGNLLTADSREYANDGIYDDLQGWLELAIARWMLDPAGSSTLSYRNLLLMVAPECERNYRRRAVDALVRDGARWTLLAQGPFRYAHLIEIAGAAALDHVDWAALAQADWDATVKQYPCYEELVNHEVDPDVYARPALPGPREHAARRNAHYDRLVAAVLAT